MSWGYEIRKSNGTVHQSTDTDEIRVVGYSSVTLSNSVLSAQVSLTSFHPLANDILPLHVESTYTKGYADGTSTPVAVLSTPFSGNLPITWTLNNGVVTINAIRIQWYLAGGAWKFSDNASMSQYLYGGGGSSQDTFKVYFLVLRRV
jgi:hypothetical protein